MRAPSGGSHDKRDGCAVYSKKREEEMGINVMTPIELENGDSIEMLHFLD